MMNGRLTLWLVALGCGTLCGCDSGPRVTPVEGVVLLDGKPLVGVEVRFAPECDPKALSAPFSRALTDESGHYNLECDNQKPGAVAGKHTVIVRRPVRRPEPGQPPASGAGPPVPSIYQSFASTPLQIEVKLDLRVYDLQLKSKSK
jgi:hypothetical protein